MIWLPNSYVVWDAFCQNYIETREGGETRNQSIKVLFHWGEQIMETFTWRGQTSINQLLIGSVQSSGVRSVILSFYGRSKKWASTKEGGDKGEGLTLFNWERGSKSWHCDFKYGVNNFIYRSVYVQQSSLSYLTYMSPSWDMAIENKLQIIYPCWVAPVVIISRLMLCNKPGGLSGIESCFLRHWPLSLRSHSESGCLRTKHPLKSTFIGAPRGVINIKVRDASHTQQATVKSILE